MNRKTTLLTLVLATAPAVALAEVRPWVSATLGPSGYLMSDVNHALRTDNAGKAQSSQWHEITTGLGFGGALGLDLGNGLAIGLGYDRLGAASGRGGSGATVELDVPAHLFRVFSRYGTAGEARARAFLELSLGQVRTAGKSTFRADDGASVSWDVEGDGLAFEGCIGGEYRATPRLALTASAGGRRAKSRGVTIDGVPARTPTGGALTIDHGGAFVRAGLAFSLAR